MSKRYIIELIVENFWNNFGNNSVKSVSYKVGLNNVYESTYMNPRGGGGVEALYNRINCGKFLEQFWEQFGEKRLL